MTRMLLDLFPVEIISADSYFLVRYSYCKWDEGMLDRGSFKLGTCTESLPPFPSLKTK